MKRPISIVGYSKLPTRNKPQHYKDWGDILNNVRCAHPSISKTNPQVSIKEYYPLKGDRLTPKKNSVII